MPNAPDAPPSPLRTGRSPWAPPTHAWVEVRAPAAPWDAEVRVPGSKSLSSRLLLLAAVARGRSRLHGLLRSDDVYWGVAALRALGVRVQLQEDAAAATCTAQIDGCGVDAPLQAGGMGPRWPVAAPAPLFLGDAGTLARFLPGLLLCGSGGPFALDASAQLRRRPLAPLLRTLQRLLPAAAPIKEALPLTLWGHGDAAGFAAHHHQVPQLCQRTDLSSQFASALLLAAPLLPRGLRLQLPPPRVQPAYVEMTVQSLRAFGADVVGSVAGGELTVAPGGLSAADVAVEADLSTAAYVWSAAALGGGRVHVAGLAADSLQPDAQLLTVLRRFGAHVVAAGDGITVSGPARLRGGGDVDLSEFSDQAPCVAALACFTDKPVRLVGIGHIRHHESNRLQAMAAAIRTLGGDVEVRDDGLLIRPRPLHGGTLDPCGDHRIAMAAALFGCRVPGVRIADPSCVAKTCPPYFALLQHLGFRVKLGDKI